MINSKLIGFECRVSQPYNLPTHELTRFVNGVEFTNCFRLNAGLTLTKQPIDFCKPVLQTRVAKLLSFLQPQQLRYLGQRHHSQQVLLVAISIHLAITLSLRIYQQSCPTKIMLLVAVRLQPIWSAKYMHCRRSIVHLFYLSAEASPPDLFINAKLLSMFRIS